MNGTVRTMYRVDMKTGNVIEFTTIHDPANLMKNNPHVCLTRLDAQRYSTQLLNAGYFKNTLIDTTDWEPDPLDQPKPPRKKLKIITSINIANYVKATGSLDDILQNIILEPDEEESVKIFIEWLIDDPDDGVKLTPKRLCQLYKNEFIPYIQFYSSDYQLRKIKND